MKLRIAILLPGIAPTGGVKCELSIASQLVRIGHNVDVVLMNSSRNIRRSLSVLGFANATSFNLTTAPAFVPVIRRLISRVKTEYWPKLDCYDVVIATSAATVLPALSSGRPVVQHAQHLEEVFATEPQDIATRSEYWSRTRGVELLPIPRIVNSSWLQKAYRSINKVSYPVVNNAIDHHEFSNEKRPFQNGGKIVVASYSGRGVPWKGFDDLLDTMSHISDLGLGGDILWRTFGSDINKAYFSFHDHQGIVDASALRNLYNSSHIYLSLSWAESFPLPPLEAMACGVAVVTTPIGTEDYARHGDNCLVVPARNPSVASQALVQLFQDHEMRQQLAERGEETSKTFLWDVQGERFHQALVSQMNLMPDADYVYSLLSEDLLPEGYTSR